MSDTFYGVIRFPTMAADDPAIAHEIGGILAQGEGVRNPPSSIFHDAPTGVSTLEDPHALHGQFADVEALLVARGWAFDRHSEARYEYDEVTRMFRPPGPDGSGGVDCTVLTDREGRTLVRLRDLEAWLREGPLTTIAPVYDRLGLPTTTVEAWVAARRAES